MKYIIFACLFFSCLDATKKPKHAIKSDEHPGWKCQEGYVQKRNECVSVGAPKNSIINEDGHTWSCKNGYKKYRNTCVKDKS